ncbi:MAG: hypothetical protein KME47_05405 [Nodosilinea sp. WJT8-NPBG4]|jgi:NhaC family Na+:H+ antiporter|nr:hypothetical protein [Nodosilinea sp. WJT8-NPBG4]
MAGTIPTLIDYSIQILQPSWIYLASAVICAIVSVATATPGRPKHDWGGAVGHYHRAGGLPAMTAEAVTSGAYFGDKTSSLSETTVLSA